MSTTKKDDYYHVGLTDDEVLQSREKNGVNLLTPPKRPSLWKLYLEKFEDPVVRVLLVAAVFSLILSLIHIWQNHDQDTSRRTVTGFYLLRRIKSYGRCV